MMRHLNRATLIGTLSGKPVESFFSDGRKIVDFKVTTSETFLTDGKRTRYDTAHAISCYDETKTEFLLNKAREGQPVFIEGKIKNYNHNGKFVSKICVGKYEGNIVFLPPDAVEID